MKDGTQRRGDPIRPGRRRALIPLVGIGLALAGLLVFVPFAVAGCGSSTGAGTVAPEFSGTTIDGVNVSLSEYRGKPLVLAFMGSW